MMEPTPHPWRLAWAATAAMIMGRDKRYFMLTVGGNCKLNVMDSRQDRGQRRSCRKQCSVGVVEFLVGRETGKEQDEGK
jgi:hypothetical protein